MKKLVMSALLFATAAQAAGCIFVSGDDDGGGTATVQATWSIFNDDAAAACPDGATTAAVNAQLGNDSPFVDLYDCSAGSGVADNLPAGDYTVWVELTDDSGAVLYAQSEAAAISLSDGELATADFQIDAYNGFFDVGWFVTDPGGAEVGCAGVANQNGVSVLSTNSSTTEGTDSIFNCADGEDPSFVTTDPVAVGDYVVSLSLLDQNDLAIGGSADIVTSIDHGNEFVDLGVVEISLF